MKKIKSLHASANEALEQFIKLGIIPNDKSRYFKDALEKTSTYIEAYADYKNQQANDIFRVMKYIGSYGFVVMITALIINHYSSFENAFFFEMIAIGIVFYLFCFWIISLVFLGLLTLINIVIKSQKLRFFINRTISFLMGESKESKEKKSITFQFEESVKNISNWKNENDVLYEKVKIHYDSLTKIEKKSFCNHAETIAYVFDVTSAVVIHPHNRVFIEHSMGIPQI
jgi:hypothetical protein